MKNVETPSCGRCLGAEHPNWGIEGENTEKPIMIVLECSDYRALRTNYFEELLKSRTGGVLKSVLGDRFDQVIITNAAKCLFEGGNRKPSNSEFVRCAENIRQQIEIISPKLILCLGEKATEAVTGVKFGEALGKVYGNVVVAHHPRVMTVEEKKMIREIVEFTIPQTF
jgi:uracil-DNA glycosylase